MNDLGQHILFYGPKASEVLGPRMEPKPALHITLLLVQRKRSEYCARPTSAKGCGSFLEDRPAWIIASECFVTLERWILTVRSVSPTMRRCS
jgi:hypothetical protein